MTNNSIDPYSDLTKELRVSTDGKISVSRRGLARLCGVNESSIRYLLEETLGAVETGRKISENFAGHKFEGAVEIPDLLAAEIVFHYALLGRELAIKSLKVFSAIGLRTWGQKLLGWEALPPSSADPQIRKLELALALADRHGIDYATLAFGGSSPSKPSKSSTCPAPSPKKPSPANAKKRRQLKAKAWVEILETRTRWTEQNKEHRVVEGDLIFCQAYNERRLYIGGWVYKAIPTIGRATLARRRGQGSSKKAQLDKGGAGRPLMLDEKYPAIGAFIKKCIEASSDMHCAEVIRRIQHEFQGLEMPHIGTIRRYFNLQKRVK
jgi:hypothetical protein